jgi:hypothetical protein
MGCIVIHRIHDSDHGDSGSQFIAAMPFGVLRLDPVTISAIAWPVIRK